MVYADFNEALDAYVDKEKLHNFEGQRGVEAMCQIARALGYKDPQNFGQLSRKSSIGDLIMMLEDNSGMIEAMMEWMSARGAPEWKESLEEALCMNEDSDEG